MSWKRWVYGTWSWKRPLQSLAFIYLALLVVACGFSDRFIFHPPPADYGKDSENLVMLGPESEQIAAFYYPPPAGGPVLLWSHGNAEDIGGAQFLQEPFQSRGIGLLAYDYPGYGLSAGRPSEKSCFAAAELAYEFLTVEKSIGAERVILVGQSVGSGPACYLAEQHQHGGVVLISPLLSVYRVVMPVPLFPGDTFRNIARIKSINGPLLVIHGSRDEVIGFNHGQRLYQLHPGPKRFVEINGAGHNDIWPLGIDQMVDAIEALAKGEVR